MPPEEALAHYARILQARRETPKIDFKLELSPEGDALAEVVKDFCALANSHDPTDPKQRQGLLFIGVENDGTVRGLPAQFDHDALELRLTQRLERRVGPTLRFTVSRPIPDTASGHSYAVVTIEPPPHLPYLVLQETGRVLAGQWFVRRNSTTVLAGPDEFAELHRRLLAQEAQPIRSGLDRLAGEVAVMREELARAQLRGGVGQTVSPTDRADVPLAEAIRAEYAPKEMHLVARIRQLGRELTTRILEIDEHHLAARERTTAESLKAALSALEEAARPLAETAFEISAYIDHPEVWSAVALALEETANAAVIDRIAIDGAIAPLLWYPITLCAYAAAVAAVIRHRYAALVPMLTGTYDRGKFPLMRVVRVLPRAEEFYRHITESRHCAPLAERALQTMVGPAGWFRYRVELDPDLTGYSAEIVLSLVWMTTSAQTDRVQPDHPLPGAYLYQWRHTEALHAWMAREQTALRAAWPALPQLLAAVDQSAGKYGNGGCLVEFQSKLAGTLIGP
jgi:Putative DNA-binding domain